jgi:hypothetical protein
MLSASGVQFAFGDVVYNSLNGAPDTSLGTFPINGAGPEGDSFSTGASTFMMTDVLLKLQGVHDGGSFTVSLYSDNNTTCPTPSTCTGGPLSKLYTIATVLDNGLSTSLANYDYTLAASQVLSANTRYWIVASSSNSGTLWSYTADLSGVGVANEYNFDKYGLGPNSIEPFQMEVVGQSVPEPASFFSLGAGILAMIAGMRRRKSSAV